MPGTGTDQPGTDAGTDERERMRPMSITLALAFGPSRAQGFSADVRRVLELRPYQRAADAAITHELEVLNRRSTLYVAASGTGKSVVIAERVRRARSHGGRVLVIAHREELLA